MATVYPSPVGFGAQFLGSAGSPLAAGKIYTYAAGTMTPQIVYVDSNGITTHNNPIVLDPAGRLPSGGEVWLTSSNYKFVIQDSTGNTVATLDNIVANSQPVATTSATGLIKVGSGLGVLPDGTLSSSGTVSTIATATSVGGVIAPASGGLVVDTPGNLSVSTIYGRVPGFSTVTVAGSTGNYAVVDLGTTAGVKFAVIVSFTGVSNNGVLAVQTASDSAFANNLVTTNVARTDHTNHTVIGVPIIVTTSATVRYVRNAPFIGYNATLTIQQLIS